MFTYQLTFISLLLILPSIGNLKQVRVKLFLETIDSIQQRKLNIQH